MARNIIERRKAHGWTQADLASRMRVEGFTWQTNRVTQIETLRRPVSILELVGLSRVFGIKARALMAGDDSIELPGGTAVPIEDLRSKF